MAEKLGKAVLEISVDDTQYRAGLSDAEKRAEKTAQNVSKLSKLFTFDFVVTYGRMAVDVLTNIGKAIVELGDRGSTVSDIAGSFESLSLGVHSTAEEMLGGLRAATAGTIDDFSLMQMANKALGTGLIKSADDMATLAAGARMLSERSGKPLTETFEALTRAMVTGRTQGLVEFGFAAEKGVPIMAALRDQIAQTGPISDDFTDNVNQVRAALQNVEDTSAIVTANALPRLAQQFRNVIPAGMDLQSAVGAAMNFVANALVNTAGIAVNAITGFVQAFQAGGTSVTSIAQQMWSVLTGQVGVREAFANISALATGGIAAMREGFVAAITPTLEWRDYLKGTGEAVRAVTTDYGTHAAAIKRYNTDILLSRQERFVAEQFFRQQEQMLQATADAAMLAALQQSLAALKTAQGAYYVETMTMAAEAGFATREELEATAAKAVETYNRMKESGLYTTETLQAAWEAAEKAKQDAALQTSGFNKEQQESMVNDSLSALRTLFGKSKAGAIALAIADTAAAVVASFKNAGGWPWGLIPAAMMAAAGAKQIATIKSAEAGFAKGTPDLDFLGFGAVSKVSLHGDEAVIPRGSGHQLAAEIAAAMPRAMRNGAEAGRRPTAPARSQGEAAIVIDGEVLGRWITRRNKAGLLPVVVR